jgi:hypothetical protein
VLNLFFVVFDGGSLLAVVKAAVARVVGSDTLVAATIGSAREGSARADSVRNSTAGVASAETGDCAELSIAITVNNSATSVLDTTLGSSAKSVEVTVATSDSAGNLDISGIVGIVGNITLVIDELSAIVVVVSSVVPGTEVVGPAAISVISLVGVTIRVGAWGVSEGVSSKALSVSDVAGGVLVTLVTEASLLLSEVVVVVARDGVEGDVDLAGVVAPLVINGFLGIPMVVGSPLVPCVVNPLVVALALVADLSVGVVGISDVPLLLSLGATEGTASGTEATGTTETSDTSGTTDGTTESAGTGGTDTAESSTETGGTSATEAAGTTEATGTGTRVSSSEAVTFAVTLSVGKAISVIGALVAVVLVVGTISLRLDSVVVGSLPSLSGNDRGGEKNGLEHF